MTAVGRPTFHLPARRDPEWMTQAACSPDPRWTSDLKPQPKPMRDLRAICDTCPVMTDCAREALDERLTGGVYAGVWLPGKCGSEWMAARAILGRKAGERS